MSYKKSITLSFLFLSNLTSCVSNKYIDLFDESPFWITDSSQLIINNSFANDFPNCMFFPPVFVMYNYNNSGHSIFYKSAPLGGTRYQLNVNFIVTKNKNFVGKDYSIYSFHSSKQSEETLVHIPIEESSFSHYSGITKEEKEKIESLIGTDTRLNKLTINDIYLLDTSGVYLFNDAIHLTSGGDQLSYLTGRMINTNGDYINIILKSTSKTTFKIYEFVNKESVGKTLLEGNMSNIALEDEKYIIKFNTSNNYLFDDQYNDFTLEISQSTKGVQNKTDANYDFIFPEDID